MGLPHQEIEDSDRMAQPLQSHFPQAPVIADAPAVHHGNVKGRRKGEQMYPEAERELRAGRWRRNHDAGFPVRCGDAWPPIDIRISERCLAPLHGGALAPAQSLAA